MVRRRVHHASVAIRVGHRPNNLMMTNRRSESASRKRPPKEKLTGIDMGRNILINDAAALAPGLLSSLRPIHNRLGRAMISALVRWVPLFLLVCMTAVQPSDAQTEDLSALNRKVIELYRKGKFAKATEVAQQALALAKKELGSDHPRVATTLNNLALLYNRQGRYAEAEPLYKRSLLIRERALGGDHPDVANALNNLAGLYWSQRRYTETVPILKRSLSIIEKALGPNHLHVGTALNSLALAYESLGRYADTELLYRRSLAIAERKLGSDHPRVGATLNNLAELYRLQSRYAEALNLHRRSLKITQKALGPNHPDTGMAFNNIAVLYADQGRYEEAERFYNRGLEIRQKAFGPEHPDVAASLNNLAALHYRRGQWHKAIRYLRLGTDVITRRTRRGSKSLGRSLTGQRKTEAVQSRSVFQAIVKSAYRAKREDNAVSARFTEDTFMAAQWAGASDAGAALAKMAARQANGDAQLAALVRERQDLVDEWHKRDAVRSTEIAKAPAQRNRRQEEQNIARLSGIDTRISEIDKRLMATFPDYTALANPEPLTIDGVQEQLDANEALILFMDTPETKPLPGETFIWVVTKTTNRWVRTDIGSKQLSDHVDALRCGLDFEGAWKGARCFNLLEQIYTSADRQQGKPLPFDLNRAHALYHALFGKVGDLIKGKNVLIVPSGPLTQLPFQVLVTERPTSADLTRASFTKAAWFAGEHAITILPSVSSLKALRAFAKTSKANRPFIGFGNPLLWGPTGMDRRAWVRQSCATDHPSRSNESTLTSALKPFKSFFRGGLANPEHIKGLAPLPETADELCAVARDLRAELSDVYLGEHATEARIKDLNDKGYLAQHRVVHFATHGALAGELSEGMEPGLILTPSVEPTEKDDAYLSASEVAGLKLDADWVILSACNTAGGDAQNAEALSGLARAFFFAGARSVLVSHWYVDSGSTVSLITKTFAMLKRRPRIGRAKALQLAMMSLQRRGKHTWHPAHWAPFVLVGEGAK